MSDFISKQAAIDAIKRYESAYSYDLNNGLILAMNAVVDVPTIDAVPVVRCKDCKHNLLSRVSGNALCYLGMSLSHPYDFCSQAERKE